MNPSILILDTYYPEFLKQAPLLGGRSYADELQALLDRCFGTYDCYSRGLTSLGWKAEDYILNHAALNRLDKTRPDTSVDVTFFQDLSQVRLLQKSSPLNTKVMAGQCSCAWPGDDVIKRFDILFTSFPHYVPRFESLGVKGVYLPLAFDPIVYERLRMSGYLDFSSPRHIKVSFVGGIGPAWGDRYNTIAKVFYHFPEQFRVFTHSPNTDGWGPAYFGLEMYSVYRSSKIVLNTHHPAAEGYSNNLRMFEATGMGALLLTEHSSNITDFLEPGRECITYTSSHDAVDKIRYYLDPAHEDERAAIAYYGQQRTLRHHTYLHRLSVVNSNLSALLRSKQHVKE